MDRFYSKFTIKNAELTQWCVAVVPLFFGGDYFRVPMYTEKRLEIKLYNSFIMEVPIKQKPVYLFALKINGLVSV